MAKKDQKSKNPPTQNATEGHSKNQKDSTLESSKPSEKTSEPETMKELLSQTGYVLHGYKKGDLITGKVSSVTSKEILIDVGGKMEGVVSDKDMEMMRDVLMQLTPGQTVSCYVISVENDQGQMVLSLRKAGMDLRWRKMEEVLKKKEPVEVVGLEANKGGLIVTCEVLRGFIPSSQLSFAHSGKAAELLGKKLTVLVIEVNQSQNRLIFSEKAIVDRGVTEEKKAALSKISIGESYEGTVSGVVPYGLFVNVNGIDGLVHISEIAWEKVNSPGDYFKVGDKVKVLVLGIDEKAGKLNLSVKQLTPDPWQAVAAKYSSNQAVSGKVSRISPFGVFCELEAGIEGLIHISKIPPGKEFNMGDKVECTIESVDPEKRRISLALVLKEKPVGYK